MEKETKQKTVLITGASSGIGYEFAKIFSKNKYDMILASRNIEKLERIKSSLESEDGVKIRIFQTDLSNLNQVKELTTLLDSENTEIDVLINNAGAGLTGKFSETSFEREYEIINLNVIALTFLTKHFLRKMIIRNSGSILNVASTAAYKPGPLMAVYYATKSYVLAFTESVAVEISGSEVFLGALCPGPTETSFIINAGMDNIKKNKLKKTASAYDTALYGYNSMLNRKTVAVYGFNNKLFNLICRFIPGVILRKIMLNLRMKK